MAERPNEKQVSFFIDSKERDQFQLLCKTSGVSASNVLRLWVQSSLKNQKIDIETPPTAAQREPRYYSDGLPNNPDIKVLMERLDKVERIYNYIDEEALEFIKKEVLSDEFGTVRHRIGVVEDRLQNIGGTITWKDN